MEPDVWRWNPFRIARDRFRRNESSRHGSSHEDPVQGFDDDQQFHDRGHGSGQRGYLFIPRIHRPGTLDARDAGRSGGIVAGDTGASQSAPEVVEADIQHGDRGSWSRDALQRNLWKDLIWPTRKAGTTNGWRR